MISPFHAGTLRDTVDSETPQGQAPIFEVGGQAIEKVITDVADKGSIPVVPHYEPWRTGEDPVRILGGWGVAGLNSYDPHNNPEDRFQVVLIVMSHGWSFDIAGGKPINDCTHIYLGSFHDWANLDVVSQ